MGLISRVSSRTYRKVTSLNFASSLTQAVGEAITQKVDLIVLLSDDSEASATLDKFVNSIPSVNLINNSKCVCLKLKLDEHTTDVENIQKTFPDIKIPSVSVIGTEPTGLKICINEVEGLTVG